MTSKVRGGPENRRAAANRALIEDIGLIHAKSFGTCGSPRVHAVLRGHGRRVGRSRVERLMRRAGLRGLAALPRRTRTSDSRQGYPIASNRLVRSFQAAAPGQVWLAELTHIPTGEGWLYLAGILDLHTRKLVDGSMRDTLHAQIALEALTMAIARQKPAPGPTPPAPKPGVTRSAISRASTIHVACIRLWALSAPPRWNAERLNPVHFLGGRS